MPGKWQNFITEFLKQFQVYIFTIVYLGLFRIVLIVRFQDKLGDATDLGDILLAVAHGYRFDSASATLFMLVPFLANSVLSPFNATFLSTYLRKLFSALMLIVITMLFVVTIPYFKEYDSQFDYFLFEVLYDDRPAVMRTLFEGYGLVGNLLIFAVLSGLCIFLLRQWHKFPFAPLIRLFTRPGSLMLRSLIYILIFVLTFAAARGSFKSRPAMRKWAHVTTDIFLNKTVMNPLRHLQYAYRDFKSINSRKDGIKKLLGDISVITAAQEYFSLELPADQAQDLSNYLSKTARGSQSGLPDHIFIIVMESYDSWPLLPRYQSLKVTEHLKRLGRHGILFNHFLPSAGSTMGSLSAILTGIPFTGVNISRIAAHKPPFLTASPAIFKRLGYRTRLYYGGFLSWQNIGNLFHAQGIDEVFAAPSIEEEVTDRIWGVEDEALFTFVRSNTPADGKTFNIILTTSYHPPFSLDVRSRGFPLNEIPADIEPYFDGSMTLNMLGHIWYSDMAIGEFINSVEKSFPASLFALTGDHYGRRFLNAHPSVYEHTSVPFILYGKHFVTPQATANPAPGSHIDIVPTIVELIAPAGFQYYSFGSSMLDRGKQAGRSTLNRFGIGHHTMVTETFIANLRIDRNPAPLPDAEFDNNRDFFHRLEQKHNQLLGLGWWLIFNGELLEPAAPPAIGPTPPANEPTPVAPPLKGRGLHEVNGVGS